MSNMQGVSRQAQQSKEMLKEWLPLTATKTPTAKSGKIHKTFAASPSQPAKYKTASENKQSGETPNKVVSESKQHHEKEVEKTFALLRQKKQNAVSKPPMVQEAVPAIQPRLQVMKETQKQENNRPSEKQQHA